MKYLVTFDHITTSSDYVEAESEDDALAALFERYPELDIENATTTLVDDDHDGTDF